MKWLRALSLFGLAAVSSSLFPGWFDWMEGTWPTDPAITQASVTLLPPRPVDPYLAQRHDLDGIRQDLAGQLDRGTDVEAAARTALATYLPGLMESWVGTRYSYSGTSQVPRKGRIACGYYVSTVLEHAGFDLDRVEVARQASEQIIRTVVPEADIDRFRRASRKEVVAAVEDRGPGVYVVGLDTHVGFLLNDGTDAPVRFCHSTRRRKQGVICETAVDSPSLKSRYTVLGRLDNAVAIDSWLQGHRFATAQRGQPQPAKFGGTWTVATAPAEGPTTVTASLLP